MNREEIIEKVKNYTGIDTDEVTQVCQDHIDNIQDNEICTNIYNYDFSFLTAYAEINTSAVYDTGTVSVTQDSTTVTGSGTSWINSAHAGWYIKFNDEDEYYRISSITDATQTMTLSSAYIGTTASNISYTMYKVFYDLPSDFKKMKWAKQVVTSQKLLPLSEMTISEYFTNEFDYSGEIEGYILSGQNASGIPQVRFYPTPTSRKRIYICYIKRLPSINSTGATSLIPSQWHMLFVYKLNEIVFDMNDLPAKAAKEAAKFEKMLQAFIKEDKQITKDNIDVMQSRFITNKLAFARLNPSHYQNTY